MKSILENLTFLSLPLLKKIVFFASRRRAAPVQNRIRELNEDYASNKKKSMEMFFSFRRKEPKERRRETCSFLSFLQEGSTGPRPTDSLPLPKVISVGNLSPCRESKRHFRPGETKKSGRPFSPARKIIGVPFPSSLFFSPAQTSLSLSLSGKRRTVARADDC